MTRFVVTGLMVGAVLAACAPQGGTGPAFRSFTDDARGACFAERQELERQGTRFDTSFKAPARTADEILAVAERYLTVLISGERSFVETLTLANRDLARENKWVGWTSDAFDTLTACRRANALAVNQALKAGRIGRAAAEKRLSEIRSLYREDTARFRQFADQIALNTATFAEVYTDFALLSGAEPVRISPPPVARPDRAAAPGREVPRQTRLVRTAPKDSATPLARPALDALRSELLTNTRKRDEIYERIEKARATEETFDLARSDMRQRNIA